MTRKNGLKPTGFDIFLSGLACQSADQQLGENVMNMKNMSSQLSAVIFACMAASSGAYGAVLKLPGTGFDAAGNALAPGDIDANWSLFGGSSGTNQAYSIAPGSPDWWSGGAFNQYIDNTNTASFNGSGWISNNAASNYNGPAPYTFCIHFDLAAFGSITVSITGLWAIANGGFLEVNGNFIAVLPGVEASNWNGLPA